MNDVILINDISSEYEIHITQGKCDYCDNTTVIHRRYSGEKICPDCFTKSIEKKVYTTISKYSLLKPKDKIVIGVSGGKDSIALLYNLHKIQEKNYFAKPLIAISIDEGISGYRSNSISSAARFCEKLGVQHEIISFEDRIGETLDNIIKIHKKNHNYKYACNYCAAFRRRLLNDAARDLNADVLALGHNLTDLAETFLMNVLFKRFPLIANQYLFKREKPEIEYFFVRKVSPLMRIPEEEIFLYSNLKQFNYYASHCPYREKDPILRKRVLEFLLECKKFSPEIEFNLFNGFLELSEILYSHYDSQDYYKCQNCGYPCGESKICVYCRYKKELEES